MFDTFRFETFVDVHSNIFNEYLSSVIAKLSKENEKYQALQNEIESLYQKYPMVLGVCDSEQAAEVLPRLILFSRRCRIELSRLQTKP